MPEFLATMFLWNQRAFRLAHGASQALFESVWMGLLPESAWDAVSQQSYGAGTQYTNPRYLDSGFSFWEAMAIERYFVAGSRVLVAAAGGGRELIALARAGFQADGFECCRPMVVAGQLALAKRGINGKLEWAPPCEVPETAASCDAAIMGWNAYTYIAPRERRIAFMRSLAMHLRPKAPVLVSAAMASERSRLAIWTPRIANAVRRCTFRAAVLERGAGFPGRPRHQFIRKQIELELTEAGFSPVEFYQWGDFAALVCMS